METRAPRPKHRSAGLGLLRDVLLGAAFAAGGVVLRMVLDPWLGNQHAYTTLIAAVALAGWLVGVRCGAVTAAAGIVPVNYLFVLPRMEVFIPRDTHSAVSLAIFVLACAVILVCEARALRLIERERRATQALADANRKKDEFLSLLSHELRNPLNAMVVAAQVFKAHAHEHDALKAAARIHDRQSHQLVALIDDLLDVARITRGRIELKRDRCDVRTCIQDAVDENIMLVDARRHTLAVGLPQEPLMAIVDATRVTQIVSNLLNNAAKYSGPQARIAIRAERVDAEIVVQVDDDGPGIAPELLPRVFEAFYARADEFPGNHGLGVGLWLCSQLARLHGGSLRAHSDGPGKGARFELRLPVGENAERRREVRPRMALDSG